MLRKLLVRSGIVLGVVVLLLAGYVGAVTAKYNGSMATAYDIPLPAIQASTDSAVIERGRHVVETVGGCASGDCHGANLAGGNPLELGPLGTLAAPNITGAGVGGTYSDGELARLIMHGVKRDGTSVKMMPSNEFGWLPDADIAAVVSYVRSMPAVEKPNGILKIGLLAKVLDRHDMIVIDVARRIDHENRPVVPAPEPTAAYGAFLAKSCMGCHGEGLAGGPIPGAPASLAVPLNLTPHETGLAGWTIQDFLTVMGSGKRKDGRALDPLMPVDAIRSMNQVEQQALFAYLMSLPPTPFGER